MAEKNIEIRMAVTGADQAAAEINKPAKASENLSENVDNIARAQKAAAFSDLADMAGKLGSKFIEAAENVEEFDRELAATLRTTGENIDKVSSGVSAMAMGFAVGGPLGAGLAGIGVLLKETANAWVEMEAAQAKADSSAAFAVEMAQKLASARATYAIDVQNDGVLERLQEESNALQDQVERMGRLRQVEQARDKADAAERDFQDAEAIRGGANPEDVRMQRVIDDGEKAKARVDKEVEDARIAKEAAAKSAEAAFFNDSRVSQDPNSTEKDRKAAADALAQARGALIKADDDFRVTRARSPEEKREIGFRTTAELAELQDTKAAKIRRDQEQADREQAERQAQSAEERLDGTARRDGARFRNAGNRVGGALGNTLAGIGGKLSDGTDEKEIAALREQFIAATKGMGGETIATMRAMLDAQLAQGKEIATLRAQIKNARTGR
jgi:hypothetical protein